MSALLVLAVTTATGLPMRIGKAVLDPNVPTLFEGELPEDVEFQKINLRIREVEGIEDPTIANAPYRTADGETIDPRNPPGEPADALESDDLETLRSEIASLRTSLDGSVPREDHDAVVQERDQLKENNQRLDSNLTQSSDALKQAQNSLTELDGQLTTMSSDLEEAVKERDELKARVEKLSEGVPDVSLYEGFLPNSKSEIERLSLPKLQALASIKGVKVEGDEKAPYVAALSPKE